MPADAGLLPATGAQESTAIAARSKPPPTHEEMESLETAMGALEKQYGPEHPLVRHLGLLMHMGCCGLDFMNSKLAGEGATCQGEVPQEGEVHRTCFNGAGSARDGVASSADGKWLSRVGGWVWVLLQ